MFKSFSIHFEFLNTLTNPFLSDFEDFMNLGLAAAGEEERKQLFRWRWRKRENADEEAGKKKKDGWSFWFRASKLR